jgi:quinol monooxygenase YgiN
VTEVAIIVRYQAIAGNGDQVAALLSRHTAATRAEPGCREAFDAHLASPHFSDIAVARIRPLLRDRILEFQEVIAPLDEP